MNARRNLRAKVEHRKQSVWYCRSAARRVKVHNKLVATTDVALCSTVASVLDTVSSTIVVFDQLTAYQLKNRELGDIVVSRAGR